MSNKMPAGLAARLEKILWKNLPWPGTDRNVEHRGRRKAAHKKTGPGSGNAEGEGKAEITPAPVGLALF